MSGTLNTSTQLLTGQNSEEVTIDTFRKAMRALAGGGVAVVTVGQDADRTGFTATSVESLATQPRRLLVSVSDDSSSWKALQKCPYFGVNVLRAEHQTLAGQFAGRGGLRGLEKYRGATWTNLLPGGAAILKDALVGIDCIVEEILPRHGHAIVIGRVRGVLIEDVGHPLLFWQGAYRQISAVNL
jgi:flavin reductase (DIM6/NTAB) family NADH-FMN oxidoreductase RutF